MFIVVINEYLFHVISILSIKRFLIFVMYHLFYMSRFIALYRTKERDRERERVRSHNVNVKSKRIVKYSWILHPYIVCVLRAFVRTTSPNQALCDSRSRVYDNRYLFFANNWRDERERCIAIPRCAWNVIGGLRMEIGSDRRERGKSVVIGAVRVQIFMANVMYSSETWLGSPRPREHITRKCRRVFEVNR